MMKFLSYILIICTISGCTYLSKKFESYAERKTTVLPPSIEIKKINYCNSGVKLQYISEDESLLKFYKNLNPTLFENKKFTFIQKAIMLMLIEMSRRPDESSPYARLQVYLKHNGKNYYYDFRPNKLEDDTKMPQLKGLEYLTKKFLPNQSLTSIATTLDNIVPANVNVSAEFETFLHENRQELLKNDILSKSFFKGDEALTKYETFERVSFKSIIHQYLTPLYTNELDYNFNINALDANKVQKDRYQANCNYDISKELSLRDELLASEQKKAHIMGISEGEDFFLAATSATLHRPFITSPKLSYFMKARPSPLPLPVCELKGDAQDIVLFSSDGRNPVQHLQHLISYDIDQIDSSYTLNEMLNFSRHLFLSSPDRILYESKRGRKAQLDFFLAMNFPIYHIETLGNIFGHATFKSDKKLESSLHIDDRSKARLWCN